MTVYKWRKGNKRSHQQDLLYGFTVMDRVVQLIIKGTALIIYFKTKCVHFPLFEIEDFHVHVKMCHFEVLFDGRNSDIPATYDI